MLPTFKVILTQEILWTVSPVFYNERGYYGKI